MPQVKRVDSQATIRSTRSDATGTTRLSHGTFRSSSTARQLFSRPQFIPRHILALPQRFYKSLTDKGAAFMERFYDPLTDVLLERVKGIKFVDAFIVKMTNPTHNFHRLWSIWIIMISLYMIIMTPFRIAFLTEESWVWIPFDLIFDLFLWMDVALNALTPFQPKSSTIRVTRFRRTFWQYFTSPSGALLDVLPLIPLDWLALIFPYTTAVFRVHRILRAVRINYYFQKLETFFTKLNPSIIRVTHLLCVVTLLAHWITCTWYFIVRMEGELSIYWTASNVLMEGDTTNDYKYLLGMYWSLISLAGYGGTMPVTDIESVFSIAVAFLGIAVYVTIIGTIGSLVTNLDSNSAKFREKMDTINDYMQYRSLDDNIRSQVRTYYNYIWNSRKGLDETKILEDLPDFLKMTVALHLNKDMIKKVPLLQSADDAFVAEIVVRLKPRVSLPNSYIIRMGETGREMFFLSKGKVDVVIGNGIVVAQFTGGSFFGEIALIYDMKRTATIRATEFCDLFVLTKEDFDEICEAYPEEARKIKLEAEQRKQQTNTKKESEESQKNIEKEDDAPQEIEAEEVELETGDEENKTDDEKKKDSTVEKKKEAGEDQRGDEEKAEESTPDSPGNDAKQDTTTSPQTPTEK